MPATQPSPREPATQPSPSPPPSPPPQPPPPATSADTDTDTDTDSGAGNETIELVDKKPAGSRTSIDEKTLERTEYDDIHKVLAHVAGVYLRDEEGYGLRPNIGMRGAAAERSSKVALMEDGVLIAPAPYSAPAAYYFPLVTRMTRVDVVKGPAAIIYGPNTVGGAINLISAQLPAIGERQGYVDAALGSDLYGKLHARFGERHDRWGILGEYVKLRTDGFKQLDGGGPTGFDKDDANLTFRVTGSPTATNYQQLDLRIGYSREESDETYTGLTEADFQANPLRRYRASQLDEFDWNHVSLRADHRLELGLHRRLTTTAYRNWFHRIWGKVDSFIGQRNFLDVIFHPDLGANPIFYALLTGAADSQAPEDELVFGTNDRTFVSEGVQTMYAAEERWGSTRHQLDAGIRLHYDKADRDRYEDGYLMMAGTLHRSDRPEQHTVDSTAQTTALAMHAQDQVRWDRLQVTAGVRVEVLHQVFDDRIHDEDFPAPHTDGYSSIVIPGGGVTYDVTDDLSVLAGVYRGYVPASPSAEVDPTPELSVNYEAGVRWSSSHVDADVIGFFSDYSNLKATCTLSSGCQPQDEGNQFDGGKVRIWGAEAQATADVPLRHHLHLPIDAAYTWTRTRFDTTFTSTFGAWGTVEDGDEMPYLPRQQLELSASVAAPRWEAGAEARWHGESRDVAGQGPIPEIERAAPLLTVEVNGHLRLPHHVELYGTVDNVFDRIVIVSRRPYGARPNSPRLFTLGCKAHF
ncbi:MAG TPA: TonB-dependent receptor [Kofleriaceae bacterium]|nr:TonB-dependent receptor [Kofleriaceae bacterium]